MKYRIRMADILFSHMGRIDSKIGKNGYAGLWPVPSIVTLKKLCNPYGFS